MTAPDKAILPLISVPPRIAAVLGRPSRIAFLAAVLVLLFGAWQIQREREATIANAYAEARNLSRTLAEHSERSIETVEIVLSGGVERMEHGALNDMPRLKAFLEKRARSIRQVGALVVIDAAGNWIAAGGKSPKTQINSADRAYFRSHIGVDDGQLHIGGLISSRIDGRNIIPLSMRWNKPDGSFGGVVMASLDPQYFEAFYKRIGVGSRGTIALISDSRRFLVRHPALPSLSDPDLSNGPLFQEALIRAPEGEIRYTSPVDGVERIAGYVHLKTYPVIVMAAESVDELLSPWRKEALIEASTLTVAAAILVALGIGSDRNQTRRAEAISRANEEAEAAENRIRESETLYRTLADALPQMIWITRPDDLALTYANFHFRSYHGPVGAERMDRATRYHPDDFDRMMQKWEIAKADGSRCEVEGRLLRQDGSYRWHKLVVIPRRHGGDIIEWIATALDIDDIIVARHRLEETTDLLHLSQEAAGAGSWNLDLRSEICTFSRDSARLHGLPADNAIVLNKAEWQQLIDPQDGPHVLDRIAEAVEKKQTYACEYRLRSLDGAIRWLSGVGHAYYDEAGNPIQMIGLNFDVTARKMAEINLLQANAEAENARREAERASAAKSDFLASMSHEIRTPLNSIIGYTDLLMDEYRATPALARPLELIRQSGAALLTVVNDILDFSKIEAGQVELDPTPFSPRSLVDNVASMLSGFAADKGVRIERTIAPAVPALVLGDESRLRQILLNLSNNAIKFTNAGKVALAIEIESLSASHVALRFIVEDSGIGISLEQQRRLFQRFSQVDGSITRRFGGTGLGLAICKQLVELMGGTIGVESREGCGATFWFRVGLQIADRTEVLPPLALPAGASEPSGTWILLVEDVIVNQDLAKAVLERLGHRVDVASNGAEAVEMVRHHPYDLVLMDIQMPVMDGVTATRTVRSADHANAKIPIVAMTANVLPHQIATLKDAGMDDHVGKPFKRADLQAAIGRWTGRPFHDRRRASRWPAGEQADGSDSRRVGS